MPRINMSEFSYTKLSTFEQCPYRYYLRYVLRLEEPPTQAMQVGSAVHAAISRYLRQEGPIPLLVEEEIRNQSLLTLDEHYPEILTMVQNFAQTYAPAPGSMVLTEHFIQRQFDPQNKIIGYADLIEETKETVTVTDFKTGWKEYTPEDTRQLGLYAWVVEGIFKKPVKVRFWFLRYKRGPQVEVEPDPRQAWEWADRIIRQIESASAGPGDAGYPRSVGTACSMCSFGTECLGILFDPDDPREVAGVALRLEGCLERLKSMLKEHISSAGPVEVGGEVWNLFPRRSWKFEDPEALYNFLAGAVDNPWRYFKPDGRKLAPLLKSDLADDIRALGTEVVTSYLGHKPVDQAQQEEGENDVA